VFAQQDRAALRGHGREQHVEQKLEQLRKRAVDDELARGLAQRVQDPVLAGERRHRLVGPGDPLGDVTRGEGADVQRAGRRGGRRSLRRSGVGRNARRR
jgi:hypothetical protein